MTKRELLLTGILGVLLLVLVASLGGRSWLGSKRVSQVTPLSESEQRATPGEHEETTDPSKEAPPAQTSKKQSTPSSPAPSTPEVIAMLVGAGDISGCTNDYDEATAKLLDSISGTVFTTGDNVYDNGTSNEFTNCYQPTWGRHLSRTRPSPGNHDYGTANAAGYFGYFGANAGDPSKGYYSYNLGAWHVISLNSNCSVVSCSAGSAQEQWLRSDLAANKTTCTLAYWHHPRFSSGTRHGDNSTYEPFWQALYDYGADVVLVGHEHNYERFAPQTPQGVADATKGIRQFVIGTGGRSLYGFGAAKANSEVRESSTYGVLKLTLKSSSYSWQFVPVAGSTFTDTGNTNCH